MAAETTATVEETAVATERTTVVNEKTTPELIPLMAQRCCDDYSDYDGMTFNSMA